MDALLFHPKVVHLPIALAVLMPLVTGGLLLAWWRDWLPRRAWVVAVVLQALLVGSGLLAMRTGEADEERVEAVVAEGAIEAHEEAAELFVWIGAVSLALVLAGAFVPGERVARGLAGLAVAGTVATLLAGVAVGEAGGRLVYQHGAAAAFTGGAGGGGGGGGGGEGPTAKAHGDDD